MIEKPRLFIGSSVEGLEVANTVQELLDFDYESTVWNQGVFNPSSSALADLYIRTRRTDLSLFVFTPDDVVEMRGQTLATPRDNVIFELGLFLGASEPDRCFILQPRGAQMHLPTDILGMTPLTYTSDRRDENLLAALGPACNQLRRAARRFQESRGVLKFAEDRRMRPAMPHAPAASLEDYLTEWNGPMSEVRQSLDTTYDPYGEDAPATRAASKRIFGFLDNLADAILSGDLDEEAARRVFQPVVRQVWPQLATSLAPANHVEDFWNPPPRLSELFIRWQSEL